MSIQENIAEIRRRIAVACAECGRDPKEITLVGASKMNDAAACREAIAAGIDVLGENRVQEMTEKLAQGAYEGAPLHFIGHLQRRRADRRGGGGAADGTYPGPGSDDHSARRQRPGDKYAVFSGDTGTFC